MPRKPIIVADQVIPFIGEMYDGLADVRAVDGHAFTPQLVRDADILLVRSVTPVTRQLLEGSRVTFVGTATIGHDHVDLPYLDQASIRFVSAPGSNANSVSEYVTAALCEASRRRHMPLEGKTIGVIGVGNVGRRVVTKMEALGLRVLRNDPPVQRATGDPGFVPLDEALRADIVTCHVPLTKTGPDPTHHLIDGARLARLRDGALLINTSRGGVVDGAALKAELQTGRIAAILDVWEGEPKIDVDLLSLVMIGTPHIAGYSTEGKTNGSIMLYEAVCRYLGVPVAWSVNGKLPPPARVTLVPEGHDRLEQLRSVVQTAYPIQRDDEMLREMSAWDPDRRAEHFKQLRSRYPVRREFPSMQVDIPADLDHLRAPIAGLGFGIKGS